MILIDNYLDFKNFITTLEYKPTLLLHACCAPCSTHCLMVLKNYFDITIFYSNDNIYPEEEYDKRLEEIINFCKAFDIKIKVVDDGYNHQDFLDAIKGKEDLGERSERCYNCTRATAALRRPIAFTTSIVYYLRILISIVLGL